MLSINCLSDKAVTFCVSWIMLSFNTCSWACNDGDVSYGWTGGRIAAILFDESVGVTYSSILSALSANLSKSSLFPERTYLAFSGRASKNRLRRTSSSTLVFAFARISRRKTVGFLSPRERPFKSFRIFETDDSLNSWMIFCFASAYLLSSGSLFRIWRTCDRVSVSRFACKYANFVTSSVILFSIKTASICWNHTSGSCLQNLNGRNGTCECGIVITELDGCAEFINKVGFVDETEFVVGARFDTDTKFDSDAESLLVNTPLRNCI